MTIFVTAGVTLSTLIFASSPARKAALAWSYGEFPRAFFQRDETGRRQNTGLPHAAAEPLPVEPGLIDQGPGTGDNRTHRAPSAFERQNVSVSIFAASCFTLRPQAAAALNTRAPSI